MPSSAPAIAVTAGVSVDAVVEAVVVVVPAAAVAVDDDAAAESVRSFFRNRRRVVSSGSVEFPFGTVAVFVETFADGSVFGDVDLVSLVSGAFLLVDSLFGDNDAFKLPTIIDGFSKIFGTICGELPNFELFFVNGLLSDVNERNSVLSALSFDVVHVGTSRRHDASELPNRLFNPLDFGDIKSLPLLLLLLLLLPLVFMSDFNLNADANEFVSPFLMVAGSNFCTRDRIVFGKLCNCKNFFSKHA